MRKNGWQLPYHPLQVVAIAVFLALGFAFFVFFVPFVGKKAFEYVVVGLYTPLVTCVFCLYVWCAATNPADPGVFKSKKYLNLLGNDNHSSHKQSQIEGGSISSKNEAIATTAEDKALENFATTGSVGRISSNDPEQDHASNCCSSLAIVLFGWCLDTPCSREKTSEQNSSEDGMFYCSLCEVEVRKYSKHCRVCDKCVDSFDHHCRWLNNCIGKGNYKFFFVLMVSALLLLVLQWSIGILVLVRCFIERKRFNVDIASKLGSSFSLVPFVVVVVSCTFLAMIATLPLAQLFFFHVLLIKKGISTYDYIVALREQEQQVIGGQQSPQMSPLSSVTGLSSASSFNNFHRAAWCTPPRLFLEDQFDVVPPESGSSKRMAMEEHSRKKNNGTIKISPWTLARLNAEEVSKAAAQARKKSRVLQPVKRRENALGQDKLDITFSGGPSTSGRMSARIDNRMRVIKRNRLFTDLPLEPLAKISDVVSDSNGSDLAPETSVSLAPLQLEARSAFHTSRAMSSARIVAYSPDSSLGSPDLHPFCVPSSGTEESQGQTNPAAVGASTAVASQTGMQLSRSTSDGYEASGGEDSDRVPTRIVPRSSNWSNLLFNSSRGDSTDILRGSSSMGLHENMGLPY